MKQVKKIVGLLLCLAMVLSVLPAAIVSAAPAGSVLEEMEDVVTPIVGYYSNNNTDGSITSYYNASYGPVNMVNGNTTDQSRSNYYTYEEIANGTKVPVILFDFGTTANFGAIEVYGYQTSRYNMEDFVVQVYTEQGWQTAATVTDAFYVEGSFGDTLTAPLTVTFDQTYTGTKLRILVSGISDMTPDGEEDADMLTGSYIRIREIKLYGTVTEETPEGEYLETAKLNGVDIGEYVIVYSADELDYNLRAAEYIQEAILTKTGRTLNIVEDNTAAAAHEIIVGQTNRSLSDTISAPADQAMKFTITSDGNHVAMEADYFIIAGAAYYFVDTYISTSNFENTVPTDTRELAPITKKAKNYIMMIGDGMGYMQTRFFEKFGASPTTGTYGYGDGEDIFYGYYFPYQGESKTANVFGTITDSAAGGTALATGYKTINGYVGRDMYEKDITNLSELAWNMGKAVGIMSTEGSDGATPAAFSAHTSGRYDNEVITDQDALESQGYLFVERYRNSSDAANAVFKAFTAEEFTRWETKALNGLNKLAKDPDGFFMMYEEAYIDKNCHNDDQENAYRTVYRFNQIIANFMEFAMYNPDTFILITADHETSGLTEEFVATQFNLPPETGCDHSLQNVPVFAYGEGGELFNNVVAQNTSIGRTFAHLMTDGNADDFGDAKYPILTEGYVESETPVDPDAPVAPTTPVVQGTTLEIVSPKKLTTTFGYYSDRTGANENTFIDREDGYCVTDGWYIRAGYSECTSADGLIGLVMNVDSTINLGGIELVGKNAENNPVDFDIQAWVNGAWVTVLSVDEDPFTSSQTVKYTFDTPVQTNKIRMLINAVAVAGNQCYLNEVTLFESKTGNLKNTVNLVGQMDVLTDGDKSTCYTGTGGTIGLTVNGEPTAVSGFNLYHARANNTAYPGSVQIAIQTTPGGVFMPIGTFVTNWDNVYPLDSVFVTFDQTYMAYAMNIIFDKRSAATELELFAHIHEDAPEEPPVDPTEPTEPSVPTQPTEPAVVPPAITKQPAKAYVAAGKTAKFTVTATGTDLTYQWQSSADGKTWKNCSSSSATSATFKFTAKTSHSSNYYRCVITDAAGNEVTTDAVKIYVLGVTTQPKTQSVAKGDKVTFKVAATGAGKTYQWQSSADGKTWKNCSSSSATSATFTFTGKTTHNGNYYRCKITDSKGNVVYTDTVRLYVGNTTVITKQPVKAYTKAGAKAKFTVEAAGAGLKYQWQSSADGKTWKNCSSSTATKATFTFTSKASHSSNYYRCRITDSKGNVVYADAVRLYVLGVVTQPKTQKVEAGEKVTYKVAATGAGKTYQWQVSTDGKTWKNCSSSSAKKATFTFTGKTSHSSNYYRCRVTDSKGNVVYTNAVRLYVLSVTKQPVDKTVESGNTVKFTVTATGAGKTYQWQVSTDGKTWKNCSSSSAKKATFTFTGKTSHDGNYYRCQIKDSGGNTVYTDTVKLRVRAFDPEWSTPSDPEWSEMR